MTPFIAGLVLGLTSSHGIVKVQNVIQDATTSPYDQSTTMPTAAAVQSRLGSNKIIGECAENSGGTSFPLGYYGGNPGDSSFLQAYTSFVRLMGSRPVTVDTYFNFSNAPSQWPAMIGWDAWAWAQTGNGYVGLGSSTVPVIGVPMYSTSGGWPGNGGEDVDQFYQQIISGEYDSYYQAAVDSFVQNGYRAMFVRLGYEFDGNFMSWSPGNSSSPKAVQDFVSAWRHLANLYHERGKQDNVTVYTVWNPSDINWTSYPVASAYPGDQYVDVISSDGDSINMERWQAETATGANPQSGWSLASTIALAKQHNKPIALSETAAGPNDDPTFVQWEADMLHQAQGQGVRVLFVNVLDIVASDGNWAFSAPGAGKPNEAQAWKHYFGAGSGGCPGPAPGNPGDVATSSNDTSQ